MHILSFLTGLFMTIGSWFGFTSPPITTVYIAPPVQTTSSSSPTDILPSEIQTLASTSDATGTTPIAAASTSVANDTLPPGSPWETVLPLGDGKYTTKGPRQGYIYLCHAASSGQGAQGNPPWIQGDTWIPGEKAVVDGSVSWPNAYFSERLSGLMRVITGNGLPTDHPTGTFPIQQNDPARQYDANPNTISAQQVSLSLPAIPALLKTPECIYARVGVMDDGVVLFDGFDAEYRDALAHEVQDEWEGHPDENGTYHDHGFETYFVKESADSVVGFAYDGFPITGSRLPGGTYLHTADLDECHGITSPIMLDGRKVAMYHYVLTQDFPYSVSCFRAAPHEPKPGTPAPASSQVPRSGAPMIPAQENQGSPPAPPQEAIAACNGISSGAPCSIPNGPSGVCRQIGPYFACQPQ